MSTAVIFLHGSYPAEHFEFYRQAIVNNRDQRLIIAADGGLMLFVTLGLKPDLVIGDFDSIEAGTLEKFNEVEIIQYPVKKDATDGELAIRAACQRGCNNIELYGAIDTRYETDHLLANLLLLKLARRLLDESAAAGAVRAIDHCQRIYLIENEALTLNGKTGDFISIIPISETITLSIKGTDWELDHAKVQMGSSRTLRNRLSADSAVIVVTGAALAVHRYS